MAKCLVLGANGFIGSHLVDSLVESNHSVRAFGRFRGEPVFESVDGVELFPGDFLNKSDLLEALRGIEYVFHFISTTTPATAENDPLIDIETNIRMSVELLQLCVEAGVKKVLFASTGGAIYGEGGDAPRAEDDTPHPMSPYAIGKLTVEHYLHYFRVKFGLESTTFRISNPYGERQPLHRKQGVIPIFLENILSDRPITILGDGSMVRDYVYVKDVTDMIAAIFDKETKSDTYNIGAGNGTTVAELVRSIEEVSSRTAKVTYKPTPATFVHKIVLDTERYGKEFGSPSLTTLSDGLRMTLAYIERELKKT